MNNFLFKIVKNFPGLIKLISRVRWLRQLISHFIINKYANTAKPRPRPFSMASPYTSWRSLTDKTFTGRHLAEANGGPPVLPCVGDVVNLWRRKDNTEIASTDTSMLFSFFAQWFTDSFLRTDPSDRRRNTSNHEIDLCQVYGLSEDKTNILRSKKDGKLKCQYIDGEMYPCYLFDVKNTTTDNWVFANKEFKKLHLCSALKFIFNGVPEERLKRMFAVGLEHGNSSIGYTAINTIMLREHNRICDKLKEECPGWDDERLFQTARNIMIVLLIKIVLRDYIGHIATIDFPLEAKPGMAEKQPWYRTNWISIEFNLLYRWHSMVPEHFIIGGKKFKQDEFRSNTPLFMKYGVGPVITAASCQKAGRIGLYNTPSFFFDPLPMGNDNRSVMERTIDMMRTAKLRSFNDYREAFSLPRLSSYQDLTNKTKLQKSLKKLYGDRIDNLEWHVGIFAEQYKEDAMMGDLMTHMVAYDAFTHALTNPLLSKYVYNAETFSPLGLQILEKTNTLEDIVKRNVKDSGKVVARFKHHSASEQQ